MAVAEQRFEDVRPTLPGRAVLDGQQDGVFAPEAGEGKHAGQGQAAEQERPVGNRHAAPQAAEVANVDHPAHGVHHAAGAEEQQGLEKGMGEQMEHAGRHADQRARAQGRGTCSRAG